MKIFGLWAALTSILYVMQTSLLPIFNWNGISTNFMLLLTVSTAFLFGHRYGVFIGFSAGLIQDLSTGSYFGCDVFSYMFIGLICGKFSDHIFKDQFFLPVIASIFATVIHYFIMVAFIYLLGYPLDIKWNVQQILLPMVVYQLLFAYPVHKIVYEFNKKLNPKSKYSITN